MGRNGKKNSPKPLDRAELETLLQALTGQTIPLAENTRMLEDVATSITQGHKLGYSQFNELLLSIGYDRVDIEFFRFLCDPETTFREQRKPPEISSADSLRSGVNSFRELSLLLFGNVKYGFKALSGDPDSLIAWVHEFRTEEPVERYSLRHNQLFPLQDIKSDDCYLLGYISGDEIERELRANPNNPEVIRRKEHRDSVVEKGRWNHNVYLTSDHLDVYVATSMRLRHEFVFVNEFLARINEKPAVSQLNLRFFDPTQAYCHDRLDKGLAEALMLKRAQCTVYLAQESDTLGKDSELASTLAQGKPVIAFIPKMSDKFWKYLYQTFITIYPDQSEERTLLQLLQIYKPDAAWQDDEIKQHLSGNRLLPMKSLRQRARAAVEAHYNKRASILKDAHPLGLQTNLGTGVANGVLVCREISVCAELIRRIVLNKMQFYIEDRDGYVLLREKLTDSIFRVMTNDRLLTNSFWNFYNAA
ncbi:hypothetical protein [Burkholderia multivorans]|uniref:hypothetical protein n=1 Tax=Burkholderia multivorans TaxID=87883 RepID=UPI001C22C0A6|nr:hypothetical protein [Burkholderia multivorans]MBU9556024.1 hypothetical protein [Burkholderia multivorans]